MNNINKLSCIVALCAFLSAPLAARADDIQDAYKLFKQGQNAQATAKVDAILASRPKDARARFLKGLIFAEEGRTDDAIAVFSALTEDYPELPEPYNNLAVLYAGQGQYDKARDALELAIRTHPSYATAHENLGDIYAKMASQAYDRALQLDKGNTSTQTKLALIRELFSERRVAGTKPAAAPATARPATAAPGQASAPAQAAAAQAPAPAQAAVTAAPAAAKPVAPVQQADAGAEVLKATQEWAAAWSAKDSAKYLTFYAEDFRVPGGESRSAWEAVRRDRLTKPKSIRVEVREPKVSIVDDAHVTVRFQQSYRASHLRSVSRKTLDWVKVGQQWLIAEERSE